MMEKVTSDGVTSDKLEVSAADQAVTDAVNEAARNIWCVREAVYKSEQPNSATGQPYLRGEIWRAIQAAVRSYQLEIQRLTPAPSASVEEIAREAADDIFGMFGGVLNRIVDRIESGLTDGIADECSAVKFDGVKDPIATALQSALAPMEAELEQVKANRIIHDDWCSDHMGVHCSKFIATLQARLATAEADTKRLEQLQALSEQDDEDAELFHLNFDWSLREWNSFRAAIDQAKGGAMDSLQARLATAEAALEQAELALKAGAEQFAIKSDQLAECHTRLATAEAELQAYREGGLTEEILRRADGYIKVGRGCAIVLAKEKA